MPATGWSCWCTTKWAPRALPALAAYGTVFAAAAPEVRAEPRKYRAAYITPPTKNTGLNKTARDPVLAKDLWELTERTLEEAGV